MGAIKKTRGFLIPAEAQRLYDQGLTDNEIGERCGVAQSTVSKWRREKKLQANRRSDPRREETLTSSMDRLQRDCREAERLGISYGRYKQMYPYTELLTRGGGRR